MPELVLYGIRLLAKQFLGTVLDIEVDNSVEREESGVRGDLSEETHGVSSSPGPGPGPD